MYVDKNSAGLSAGEIFGIVIASVAGAFILISLLAGLCKLCKMKKLRQVEAQEVSKLAVSFSYNR
jgi:hypothetical protein